VTFINPIHLNAITHHNNSPHYHIAGLFDDLVFGIQLKAAVQEAINKE